MSRVIQRSLWVAAVATIVAAMVPADASAQWRWRRNACCCRPVQTCCHQGYYNQTHNNQMYGNQVYDNQVSYQTPANCCGNSVTNGQTDGRFEGRPASFQGSNYGRNQQGNPQGSYQGNYQSNYRGNVRGDVGGDVQARGDGIQPWTESSQAQTRFRQDDVSTDVNQNRVEAADASEDRERRDESRDDTDR